MFESPILAIFSPACVCTTHARRRTCSFPASASSPCGPCAGRPSRVPTPPRPLLLSSPCSSRLAPRPRPTPTSGRGPATQWRQIRRSPWLRSPYHVVPGSSLGPSPSMSSHQVWAHQLPLLLCESQHPNPNLSYLAISNFAGESGHCRKAWGWSFSQ
jgi:hypothetical protein